MSKRLLAYKAGSLEPLKKKASTFTPWTQSTFIPDEVKNGNVKLALSYLINLNLSTSTTSIRVALKHQLYSVVESRTSVDRGISSLLESGEIKLFKTSLGADQLCVMFTQDYSDFVKSICLDEKGGAHSLNSSSSDSIVSRFLDRVLPDLKDISIGEAVLVKQHGFKDAEVTELIKHGLLTVKNAGAWWISVPNIGSFLKSLRKGRQAIMQTIKRTKYKEIRRDTLLSKKTLPSVKLSLEYQMHDVIGADLVQCIETTTGVLLRLPLS